jgi:hypothetical protein
MQMDSEDAYDYEMRSDYLKLNSHAACARTAILLPFGIFFAIRGWGRNLQSMTYPKDNGVLSPYLRQAPPGRGFDDECDWRGLARCGVGGNE